MARVGGKKTMTILLSGKNGAGKSTLMNTLLGNGAIQKPSPDPTTDRFIEDYFSKNGVEIRIIDTPGLMGKEKDKKELKMLSEYTRGSIDLLVYCVPVGASHRFHECNPEIMKHLTEGFGMQIWEHCILVFTMSDEAYSSHLEDYSEEQAIKEYQDFLHRYANKFQDSLRVLGVQQQVKTVFKLNWEAASNTIIAVPAGKTPHNDVLPGLPYQLPDYCEDKNWISLMIEAFCAKCPQECASLLLEYKYGRGIEKAGQAIGGLGGFLAIIGIAVWKLKAGEKVNVDIGGTLKTAQELGGRAGGKINDYKTDREKAKVRKELNERQGK